ncbi:hypothetical protein C2W62_23110 [Candidatus Entotheonella serta]|nr:hypothetical protein C2W62_23110 [Candidatus Entotheonella serta]
MNENRHSRQDRTQPGIRNFFGFKQQSIASEEVRIGGVDQPLVFGYHQHAIFLGGVSGELQLASIRYRDDAKHEGIAIRITTRQGNGHGCIDEGRDHLMIGHRGIPGIGQRPSHHKKARGMALCSNRVVPQ